MAAIAVIGIIIGIIVLSFGADLILAWLIVKGLFLVFGLVVNFWGVVLLLIALQLLVGFLRGGRK